jgi:hypothetical protein
MFCLVFTERSTVGQLQQELRIVEEDLPDLSRTSELPNTVIDVVLVVLRSAPQKEEKEGMGR